VEPIISPRTRIRHPDLVAVGRYSIIDDFCYISTRARIGRFCHVASGCSIAGGKDRLFVFEDFGSLSSGVKVWCTSDDFVNDLVTIIPPGAGDIKEHLISGDVRIGPCAAVGSNSVVMPDNHIPEGAVVGALSFVPARYPFEPWTVYAGTPIRPIKKRNRAAVLAQRDRLEAFYHSQRRRAA
jgi:galactoside O-acetyltransferase/dTDP-4-amino-4,6-dideoxygalactose transaminase